MRISNGFDEDATRVFIESGIWNVQLIECSDHAVHSNSRVKSLQSLNDIHGIAKTPLKAPTARVFMIRQKNSWSRLQISHRGFVQLLNSIGASNDFEDFARAFGYKSSQSDENFGAYCQGIHYSKPQELCQELSYIIRYPFKVERQDDYPWVLRQVAVYQNYCPRTSSSNWLFLQPSEYIAKFVTESLDQADGDDQPLPTSNGFAQLLNLIVLLSTESGWRQYINYLESEINALDEKACYSRVGIKVSYDFPVTFSDSQELQQSRQRLLRALFAVNSSLESCIGIQTFLNKNAESDTSPKEQCTKMQLEMYKLRMQNHQRALTRLLEVSKGTSNLLFKILDFRHDEAFQISTEGIQAILQATRTESESMRIIAEKTRNDSRSTKILAFITLAYLPANLIAAIYSTSLVSTDDTNDASVRRSKIGYYILSTLLLTISTLLFTWALERKLVNRQFSELQDFFKFVQRFDRYLRNIW